VGDGKLMRAYTFFFGVETSRLYFLMQSRSVVQSLVGHAPATVPKQ
jgi:hypothetical protein